MAEVCSRLEPRLARCPDVEHPPRRRAQMAPTAQRSIWSTLLPGARKSGAPPDAAAALTTMLPPPLASCSSWLRTGDIQARPAAGHIPQMARPVPGPLTYDAGTVGHHVRRFLAFEHYMDSEHVRTKSRFTSDGISPLAV